MVAGRAKKSPGGRSKFTIKGFKQHIKAVLFNTVVEVFSI